MVWEFLEGGNLRVRIWELEVEGWNFRVERHIVVSNDLCSSLKIFVWLMGYSLTLL